MILDLARLRRVVVAPLLLFTSARVQDQQPVVAVQRAATTSALPVRVVEVPAAADGPWLALFMSGDGGWVAADRKLSEELAAHGVAVLGLDSRSYLSHHPTPDETASDMARTLSAYLQWWKKTQIVLIGSSRGADLVPFVANRLPTDLRARIALIVMFGVGRWASFEFHWSDIVFDTHRPTDLPVLPELERLRGTRMLCVYGRDEANSLCSLADTTLMAQVARDGGHRLRGDQSSSLARLILTALDRRSVISP